MFAVRKGSLVYTKEDQQILFMYVRGVKVQLNLQYELLLYRQDCFTEKCTTCKIHRKLHPGHQSHIFHILTSEDINDIISRLSTVVCANSR